MPAIVSPVIMAVRRLVADRLVVVRRGDQQARGRDHADRDEDESVLQATGHRGTGFALGQLGFALGAILGGQLFKVGGAVDALRGHVLRLRGGRRGGKGENAGCGENGRETRHEKLRKIWMSE